MRSLRRAAVVMTTLCALAGSVPASAAASAQPDPASAGTLARTVVIGGREYGPADGVQVDTRKIEITPGSGPIAVVFAGTSGASRSFVPLVTWGASYAISTESFFLHYDGKAKAAANIFNGKRIIQVCIWYTREGAGVVGAKVCSNANANTGVWRPGPEVRTDAWDSLGLFDPPTVFNISTVRIDPRLI